MRRGRCARLTNDQNELASSEYLSYQYAQIITKILLFLSLIIRFVQTHEFQSDQIRGCSEQQVRVPALQAGAQVTKYIERRETPSIETWVRSCSDLERTSKVRRSTNREEQGKPPGCRQWVENEILEAILRSKKRLSRCNCNCTGKPCTITTTTAFRAGPIGLIACAGILLYLEAHLDPGGPFKDPKPLADPSEP